MMFSYLASALNTWPLPNLAANALSTALQKRVIQYILKRTLGHLIKDGDLKLDQIEAGISTGRVEIRNVQVDNDFFEKALQNTALRLTSGLIGSISIQIPWSNLSAGEVVLELSGLDIALVIDGTHNGHADRQSESLSQTIFHAAEDVLEEDEEGKQLEESIASLAEDESAAGPSTAPRQSMAATYVVSLVDNLLARLTASVKNVSITFSNHQAQSAPIDVVLRLDELNIGQDAAGAVNAAYERVCNLVGFSVWIDEHTSSEKDAGQSSSNSNHSEESSDDDSQSIEASMYASFATAESMYTSVAIAAGEDTAKRASLEKGLQKVFDMPKNAVKATIQIERYQKASKDDILDVKVDIAAEEAAALFSPTSIVALVQFLQDASASIRFDQNDYEGARQAEQGSASSDPLVFALSISLKGLHLLSIYDAPEQLPSAVYTEYRQSCETFWVRPSRTSVNVGHYRFRIQDVALNVSGKQGKTKAGVSVGDIAMYEVLAAAPSNQANVPRVVPIFVFDKNIIQTSTQRLPLTRQEATTVPSTDWRVHAAGHEKNKIFPYRKTDFTEQGWKMKTRNQRVSLTNEPDAEQSLQKPCINLRFRDGDKCQVQFLPLHLFFDNTAIDRLLPLVQRIGSRVKKATADKDLAASYDTVQGLSLHDSFEDEIKIGSSSALSLDVSCPLIRLEIRMASGVAKGQQTEDLLASARKSLGCDVRSGLLVVDIAELKLSNMAQLEQTSRVVQFADADAGLYQKTPSDHSAYVVSFTTLKTYCTEVEAYTTSAFASIGALQSDDRRDDPLIPKLVYEPKSETSSDQMSLKSLIPCAHITLAKDLLDRLELLADDFTIWFSQLLEWRTHSEADHAAEAFKMLGSRFFGTKQSYSTLSTSSASTEIVQQATKAPVLILDVQQIDVALRLPHSNSVDGDRSVIASVSDIKLRHDTRHMVNEKRTSLSIASIGVHLVSDDGVERHVLVERTLRPSLLQVSPNVIRVDITTEADIETSFRSSQIDIQAQGFTIVYNGDQSLVQDLAKFLQSPEGAFENVVPNEVTRISVRLQDVCVLVAPPEKSARAVIVLGEATMRTKIMSEYPRTSLRLNTSEVALLCGESMAETLSPGASYRRPIDAWISRGLAKFAILKEARILVTLSKLTRPEVDVRITKAGLEVLACADTIAVFEDIIKAISPPKAIKSIRRPRETSVSSDDELLHSIDEDAFRRVQAAGSMPDLLEDDIPQNVNFLAQGKPWQEDSSEAETDDDVLDEGDDDVRRTKDRATPAGNDDIMLQNDVVTIRILDTKRGIAPTPGYFTSTDRLADRMAGFASQQASNFRLRTSDCDLSIRLFGGYDCESTRVAIEEEAKKVRKRLQKIKQMLDEGQTPDDSVEEAAATLFDSIHVALPDGKAAMELDAAALMQVVDDELDNQSETASSASTWRQVVSGRPSSSTGMSTPPTKRRRSKLMRSRDSLIDMVLKGVTIDYDSFAPGGDLSAKTRVRIGKVRILDNIKTSTWQTFLTEMASVRQRSAQPYPEDMIRLEVSQVRSASPDDIPEVRCRAAIAPLRLHIDQDALDFLKKFFMFEARRGESDGNTTGVSSPPAAGPFIQHAEIYAIKLKMDYKPKRVDYRLLRAGKTIEMMNFFNFEGSQIVLRHITLRGVMGWPKLFDMLNDLWTPDVKSNQLADVLSGITPIRSLVNVGSGLADLILLPIEHYQRDGRFSRGVRQGAKQFVKTTALEAARIGAQLATGTQVILEQAEQFLSGGLSNSDSSATAASSNDSNGTVIDGQFEDDMLEEDANGGPALYSRYANQPADLRQALEEAQRGLHRGFNQAAQTILAVPMEMYDRRSGEGGSRPVVRAVPIAVLKSAAGTSEAISKTLQGVQRELAGISLPEREEKYKQQQQERQQ